MNGKLKTAVAKALSSTLLLFGTLWAHAAEWQIIQVDRAALMERLFPGAVTEGPALFRGGAVVQLYTGPSLPESVKLSIAIFPDVPRAERALYRQLPSMARAATEPIGDDHFFGSGSVNLRVKNVLLRMAYLGRAVLPEALLLSTARRAAEALGDSAIVQIGAQVDAPRLVVEEVERLPGPGDYSRYRVRFRVEEDPKSILLPPEITFNQEGWFEFVGYRNTQAPQLTLAVARSSAEVGFIEVDTAHAMERKTETDAQTTGRREPR